MEPQVGTASCAFMILFTAASGVIQYMCAGYLEWKPALACISIGFVSGQIGQRGVTSLLKKSGRPSYVIFLLGGVVALACCTMTTMGLISVIQSIASGESAGELFAFQFDDLTCSDDDDHRRF